MRPTRHEFAFLLASWLVWALVALHVTGPLDTIFGFNDHASHVGCAGLFLRQGFRIWDHPPAALCSRTLPAQYGAFSQESGCPAVDICTSPDQPEARPLCVNWQDVGPMGYPPGVILISLPQTWLYEHTQLTYRTINLLTILEYLAAAHLLFWMLLRMVFPSRKTDDLPGGAAWTVANPWLRLGLFGLLYLTVLKETLNGFYDCLPIFAMFLGINYLARRRPVDALVAFSASLLLHYRALWYAPLVAAAALQSIPVAWAAPRKSVIKISAAAVMLALFAYSLLLIYPFLKGWPSSNPVGWQNATLASAAEWNLLLPMGAILLYLAWGRHWLVLCTMAWQLLVISRTQQTMSWHALFLLPMLGVARLDEERGVMLAAVVFYLVEAAVIFNALPLPGDLISAIATKLGPLAFQ